MLLESLEERLGRAADDVRRRRRSVGAGVLPLRAVGGVDRRGPQRLAGDRGRRGLTCGACESSTPRATPTSRPVTASFNEARLTPRSDSRQNVILNRVETVPATRSYRYVDYWGTAVTAFDLHAPHTELEVTASSVVETDKGELPEEKVSWEDLQSAAVHRQVRRVPRPRRSTRPSSRRIARVGRAHRQVPRAAARRSSRRRSGCTANSRTCPAPPACTRRASTRCARARACARTSRT